MPSLPSRAARLCRKFLHGQAHVTLSAALLIVFAVPVAAQMRTLTACTPDQLAICAEMQFGTLTNGHFQIGLRTIGASSDLTLPISIYNLVFSTGAPVVNNPQSTLLPPVAFGGASVSDPSDWEIFDTGDLIFLSALSNRGVGGCAKGADVDGFGQAVTTCGASQFGVFTFSPTSLFDPRLFTILNLEGVVLTAPASGASCGSPGNECVITSDVVVATPEPTSNTLFLLGLAILVLPVTYSFKRRAQDEVALRS